MQLIAAVGGIIKGALIEARELLIIDSRNNKDKLELLKDYETRLQETIRFVQSETKEFFDYQTRTICDIAISIYFGYILLEESQKSEHKKAVAELYFAERLSLIDSLIKKAYLSKDIKTAILKEARNVPS
ncbi:MAG: hypothetical protein IPL53_21355 [Ignavibacteria bacterium]|nr:hypothetical protein [Ignavibacteria bacterium]